MTKVYFLISFLATAVTIATVPGMFVLTNHMRDLVTAENEWVLSHGTELVLELFRKTSRFNLHLYLSEIESAILFYLRAPSTTQAKKV